MNRPKKTLVIFASSRRNGNTGTAMDNLFKGNESGVEIIDLSTKQISFYDYHNKNQNDDFLNIAGKMVDSDTIIFVTPVYWYTMSAQLKMFFDRFTDLITIRKDLGRALKNKLCYVVSSGADSKVPEGFEAPFNETCRYLGMNYRGLLYCHFLKDGSLSPASDEKTRIFAKELFN